MNNLRKAEFAKLKYNTTFKVLLCVCAVIPILAIIDYWNYQLLDVPLNTTVNFLSGIVVMLVPPIVLFTALATISNEYLTGFLKIMVSSAYDRKRILLWKFMIMAFQVVCFILIIPVVTSLIVFFCYGFGAAFDFALLAQMIGIIVATVFNCISILSVLFLFAILCREKIVYFTLITLIPYALFYVSRVLKNATLEKIQLLLFWQPQLMLQANNFAACFLVCILCSSVVILASVFISIKIFLHQSI